MCYLVFVNYAPPLHIWSRVVLILLKKGLHSLAFNPLICAPLIMTFHVHQVEPSNS